MNEYAEKNFKNILENHIKWLNNGDGMRATLSGANLSGANLFRADLRGADLRSADLRSADLRSADLRGADLRGAVLRGAVLFRADLRSADLRSAVLRGAVLFRADLRGAVLRGADLRKADLFRADLSGANLFRADLRGADLRSADLTKTILDGADFRDVDLCNAILPDPEIMNSICPMNCPEKGAFIGWKKAEVVLPDESGFERKVEVIIKLQIPAHAKRSSATSRKCRCDKAAVLVIQSLDGAILPKGTIAYSRYMPTFTYEVGQKIYVEDFDDDRWNECSTGIHFFITRQEAVDYI